MNKARRNALDKALTRLRAALEGLDLEELKSEIESLKDEEDEYYNNMPESLQNGERGEAAQQVVSDLDEVISSLDEVVTGAEAAINKLEEVVNNA